MKDDFQPVTRKKWISKRNIRNVCLKTIRDLKSPNEVNVDEFQKRLELLCNEMSSSDYFKEAIIVLHKATKVLHKRLKFERIICLGLGPFTKQFHALHQLAFIIAVQRKLKVNETQFFDPVFCTTEKEILENLDYEVLHENCEGKYTVKSTTLFYLPHCPGSLTNNLLWSNWLPEHLSNIVLINNSFSNLSTEQPERVLKKNSAYIMDVLPYCEEFPIEDDYETHNIFNDLSVHIFPTELLPASHNDMWLQQTAPTYSDDECITAVQFSKLTLK